MLNFYSLPECYGFVSHLFNFLSATEYLPTRTIIQPGWVSSSLSLSLSSLSAFSRWDNSRTLWAIELIFCMDACHDHVLWIRIWEPISPMQTGPTSQIFFWEKFLQWANFANFCPIWFKFCTEVFGKPLEIPNVWSGCDHFSTYQPDQPKSTKSENFQLPCFSSDLDEIWYGG